MVVRLQFINCGLFYNNKNKEGIKNEEGYYNNINDSININVYFLYKKRRKNT